MPAFLIPAILAGLSALSGGFANRDQNQTGTQTTSGTTTPTYDPTAQGFRDTLIQKYLSLIGQDPNLTGYTASGISDINRNTDLQMQNLIGNLSARGISGPALEFAKSNLENNRYADVTKFQQGIPLLSRQLNQDLLSKAVGLFNTIPYGTSSNQTMTSTGKVQGSPFGGAVGNLANTLAFLYGQHDPTKKTYTPTPFNPNLPD